MPDPHPQPEPRHPADPRPARPDVPPGPVGQPVQTTQASQVADPSHPPVVVTIPTTQAGNDAETIALPRPAEAGPAADHDPGHRPGPAPSQSPGHPPGPERIGPYTVRERIGEGTYGVVYLAHQAEPVERTVAIKVLKAGLHSREVLTRFRLEQRALAAMNHPGIARVFDAGVTSAGQPYLVMEFVDGLPLARHCDRVTASIPERLRLFAELCEAVQHAHQRGVIHRDLKPSNVLVTEVDGRPQIKVIDFGVAKATSPTLTAGATLHTEVGHPIGTLEYMAPEQAGGDPQDVDVRADVFALGVMLYELLVGTVPLDRHALALANYAEKLRMVRSGTIPRPSQRLAALPQATQAAGNRREDLGHLRRKLRQELEWIPLKAIEHDRARRYQSASELAADIAAYLEGRPLRAGPPSRLYQVRKFVSRHKAATALAAALGLSVVVGLVVSLSALSAEALQRQLAQAEALRATAAGNQATERGRALAAALTRTALALASEKLTQGLAADARAALDAIDADARDWEWRLLDAALRSEAWAIPAAPGARWVALSPAGDLAVQLHSGEPGQPGEPPQPSPPSRTLSLVTLPDHRTILTSAIPGSAGAAVTHTAVASGPAGPIVALCLTGPDGRSELWHWHAADRTWRLALTQTGWPTGLAITAGPADLSCEITACWADQPIGRPDRDNWATQPPWSWLTTTRLTPQAARSTSAAVGPVLALLTTLPPQPADATAAPALITLNAAAPGEPNRVRAADPTGHWSIDAGSTLRLDTVAVGRLRGQPAVACALAGRVIVRAAEQWEVPVTGQVTALHIADDRLAVALAGRGVHLFSLAPGGQVTPLARIALPHTLRQLAVAPSDGPATAPTPANLVALTPDHLLGLAATSSSTASAVLRQPEAEPGATAATLSADGWLLTTWSQAGAMVRSAWLGAAAPAAASGITPGARWDPRRALHPAAAIVLAVSPDGDWAVALGVTGDQPAPTASAPAPAPRPIQSGYWLVSRVAREPIPLAVGPAARLEALAARLDVATTTSATGRVLAASSAVTAVAPGGARIALRVAAPSLRDAGPVLLHGRDAATPVPLIGTDNRPVAHLTFTADARAVTAHVGDAVCIWDALTGQLNRSVPHRLTAEPIALAVDPGLTRVALLTPDRTLHVLSLTSGYAHNASLSFSPTALAWTAAGRRLLIGADDGEVVIWDPGPAPEVSGLAMPGPVLRLPAGIGPIRAIHTAHADAVAALVGDAGVALLDARPRAELLTFGRTLQSARDWIAVNLELEGDTAELRRRLLHTPPPPELRALIATTLDRHEADWGWLNDHAWAIASRPDAPPAAYAAALRLADRALALQAQPTMHTASTRAACLYRLGRVDEAAEQMAATERLARAPYRLAPETRAFAAMIAHAQGDTVIAAEHLAQLQAEARATPRPGVRTLTAEAERLLQAR